MKNQRILMPRQLTWSTYKNPNTFKFLIGITPNGVPSYISDVYGGRISDKELVKHYGLCSLQEEGDSIMADRGFLIEDLLPKNVSLNMPPFLKEREQLELIEIVETRRMASVRIQVARALERIYNFQIISFLPASLCPFGAQIVFVCSFLTVFMEPLLLPDRCV